MPPGIKSPIGSRTFSASSGEGQGLRTFEVPDESSEGYEEQPALPQRSYTSHGPTGSQPPQYSRPPQPSQAELEAGMRAARQAKASGHVPIHPEAKERIEYLAGLGRMSKDVPVAGMVFSIRTLKARENRAAIFAAAQVSRVETLFEGRRHQLAYSIYKIDNVDIDYVLGTDSFEAKLNYIEELDENVANYLYDQFGILNDEAVKTHGLKSEADVKEVVEDVKKS